MCFYRISWTAAMGIAICTIALGIVTAIANRNFII